MIAVSKRQEAPGIAFVASDAEPAQRALQELRQRYGTIAPEDATVIVPLGGDGFMLETLHRFVAQGVPIFGRDWLDGKRIEPAAFRLSLIPGGTVFLVEFRAVGEAVRFARAFWGKVITEPDGHPLVA